MNAGRRFSHADMAHEFSRMIFAKETWLETFSRGKKKRPDHEIEHKRLELAVLRQAAADYQRAAERKSA